MLRFAPSPTKDMNIVSLRLALYNHILSKQLNQELLIRIDDTDKEKNIEGKDKEILEMISLFCIDYSRVVHQSENIKYHTQMAMKLLLDKKVFNCFCSDEALKADKKQAKKDKKPYSYNGFCETISDETKFNCNAPFVVRSKKPENNISFIDIIKDECSYEPFEVDSFLILNQDKSPTANLASAIDDMLFNVSMIIRDKENLENTPRQMHIRKSLGYEEDIKYIHLPTIVDSKTNKNLSQSNDYAVKNLVEEGYLPVAIANYLILLGYNAPKEIFTIEEAMEWFDINKVSKDIVKFDINKLQEINKEHLKMIEELRLSKILEYADKDIGTLAKVYLDECNTIKEIKEKIDAIFNQKPKIKKYEKEYVLVKECLINAPFIDNFNDLKEYLTKQTKLENDELIVPLRHIITGSVNGPDLNKIYPLIKNYLGEIVK